ncbi:MAG: hypothetical protein AMS25_13660 [Gemmatimonas sp. SM23_52]|nr:MAG: hypothetical protein AMS25_13660 [Gemmatimonas sp. SM23_52]
MRRVSLFLFLGAWLTLPAQARAQSQWEQQVLDQLRTAGDVLGPDGYTLRGDPHTGTLKNESSEDFSIALEGGVRYILVGVCDNDCTDVDLRLLDESGQEVDSDFEDDDVPMVEAAPARAARYTVHVHMAKCSTEPCFYGVGMFASGVAAAQEATAGAPSTQNHRGRLESGDSQLSSKEYYDRYSFQGNAGDVVLADLFATDFDPFLILLSPSGKDTQNDDYEGSANRSRIEKVLEESGEWRVVVTSYEAGETGAYELSITTMRGGAPGTTAAADARFESGTLASGDRELTSGEYYDHYQLSGSSGENVVIDLRSAAFDPYLILIAPSGEQFENDDYEGDAQRSQLAMELPEDGEYRVVVTSYKPGEEGAYDLRIDRTAAVGAPGARVEQGALAAGDDALRSGEYADPYQFEGRPGQHVRLDVNSSEFDTYLMLIDPNGEHTENDDAEGLAGHSVIEADITEIGTYMVVVTSYKPGEAGAYELTMDFGEARPTATRQRDVVSIDLGERTTGRLESGDQQLETGQYSDLYVFEGTAGHGVSVEMKSSEFDTYLQLITPEGEKIENDDYAGGSDSRIDLTLRESGRYRVLSTSYRAGEMGTYQLSLSVSAAPEVGVVAAEVGALPEEGEGRVVGLFVGISDYPAGSEWPDLSYTADDAVRVREALGRSGLRPADAIVLTDTDATVGNVKSAFQSLAARTGPNDLFVLFYSGHGGRVNRPEFQPSDPDALDETIALYDGQISDDEMSAMFAGVNAAISLIVLDACFSGGFAKDVISAPGRMGLFSSEEDVTSSVAAKFRAGGYLAAFLADAVGDGLADADADGGVSAVELSQYLHERYRADVKSGGASDYVRTGGPQLGYQHLVVDRGSISPYQILFQFSVQGGG